MKPEALELLAENRRTILERGDECVMCALVKRAAGSTELLAESERGVVLLDRFGSRTGHAIVIAREHVEETTKLGWPTYAELQHLAYDAGIAIERTLAPARTFVAVLGASAQLPMSFPHFHIHVIPVYETGDGARPAHVFSWSRGVLVYDDEEARELATRLRAAWPTR
jgi:diadenosine tetraphosphate (Ap4A) HIT family hydrolase